MTNNNKPNFKVNDLVLGQLRGYPWWPGFISSCETNGEFKVIFFPDFSYTYLSDKKIKVFNPKIKSSEKKYPDMEKAMECAMRVYTNKSSVMEEHELFLKSFKKPAAPKTKNNSDKKIKNSKPKQQEKKITNIIKKKNSVTKKKKISKPKPKIEAPEKKTKKFLEIVNSERTITENNKPNNSNTLKTSQNLLANNKLLRRNETCSVWSKQSDKDNINRFKETRSYKEKIFFKDSVNKSTLDNYPLEENSDFVNFHNMGYKNFNDEIKIDNFLNSSKKIKETKLKNSEFAFFEINNENNSHIFNCKTEEKEIDEEAKTKIENDNKIFFEIEKEMEEIINELGFNNQICNLEDKLKVWYELFKNRINFKLILDTKIGKYLSVIKEHYNKEIEKNEFYENIKKTISNCEYKIYQKILDNFFGKQKEFLQNSNEKNNLLLFNKKITESLSSINILSPSQRSSFEIVSNGNLLKDKSSLMKQNEENVFLLPHKINEETEISKNNISEIKTDKEIKPKPKKKNSWNIKNKVQTYVREIVTKRISESLYLSQEFHVFSTKQVLNISKIFEELIGSYSNSFIHYQKMVLYFIKEIKKQKNKIVDQLLNFYIAKNLRYETLEHLIQDFFDVYN